MNFTEYSSSQIKRYLMRKDVSPGLLEQAQATLDAREQTSTIEDTNKKFKKLDYAPTSEQTAVSTAE